MTPNLPPGIPPSVIRSFIGFTRIGAESLQRAASTACSRRDRSLSCASGYLREDRMGQVLGLGVTHFPPLSGPDENLGRILKRALDDPAIPERLRRPDGWPAAMREEYGSDAGLTAA